MGTCYYVVQRTGHTRLAFGRLATVHFLGLAGRDGPRRRDDPAGNDPEQGIRRARVVHRSADRRGLGLVRQPCSSARWRGVASSTSTWRTGTTAPSSSPLGCCTSSTTWRCRSRWSSRTRSTRAASMRWCSGGTAITRWRSSSPRAFSGMMYYFVPRQAQQPLWSYRFSIINFWALISVYMWAGAHHLLYTALPDWVQSVGMAFSLMLLMPSLGSAANGLLTFNGSLGKAQDGPRRPVHGAGPGLLRRNDLRRLDDGDQVGQLADPLHRMDRRSRAFRGHRLGGDDRDRLAVCHGAKGTRSAADAFARRRWMLHFWLHTAGLLLYSRRCGRLGLRRA